MSRKDFRKTAPTPVIVLFIVLLVILIPVAFSLYLSFVDYSPPKGLFGSQFVGFANFSAFISSLYFGRTIGNSLFLWFISFVTAFVVAVPTAILCSFIPNRKTAATCAGLLLLPAFVPAGCYFILALKMLSPMVFVKSASYALGFAAQTFIPGAALIAFAGTVGGIVYRARGKNAVSGSLFGCLCAALLFSFTSLMPNFEANLLSTNPLVYAVSDTLENHVTRSSVLQMHYSSGAAIYIIRSILQIILAIVPAVVLIVMLKKQNAVQKDNSSFLPGSDTQSPLQKVIPWVLATVLGLCLLFATGIPAFSGFSKISINLGISVLMILLAAIIGGALSMALFYGAYGSGSTLSVIVAVILLSTGNSLTGQYLLARQFGLVNTLFPMVMTAWIRPQSLLLILLFVLLISSFARSRKVISLLGVSASLFVGAQAFGNSNPSIFASSRNLFPMGLILRSVINAPDAPGTLAMLYIMTLLPCLLLGLASVFLIRKAIQKMAD